jgi:thiamine biosynthesis lipoprotein
MAVMTETTPSCRDAESEFTRFAFTAMGSPCEIFYRARSHAASEALRESVMAWLAEFEDAFSFYREDSLVSRINRSAGREGVAIGETAAELFALCDWFYWLTGGYFDPTSGPLLRLWDYHDPSRPLPTPAEIEMAQAHVGWSRVEHTPQRCRLPESGMAIDLGGIGKEFAVDKVMELILTTGVRDALVNFGHDVRVVGEAPQGGAWGVGLEDPRQPGRCWAGLQFDAAAVCSSGDYMRFRMIDGKRYGHIVDSRTGYPVENGCLSVTVEAPTCTEAGILSTTAFMMGQEEGLDLLTRHFGAEGAIWTDAGVVRTPGFDRHVVPDSVEREVLS